MRTVALTLLLAKRNVRRRRESSASVGPPTSPPPAAPSMKRAQLWRTLDEIDDSRARAASAAARVRAVSR
eukprot:COSAG01_NODE_511_length_16061_cov_15.815875_16_plen_70_part_00